MANRLATERREGRRRKLAIDATALLGEILELYAKAQWRVFREHGGDAADVELRIKRMRDWGEFCARERDPETRIEIYRALFGSADFPEFSSERSGRKNCQACDDTGLVFSPMCRPRKNNRRNRTGPGWVTCSCPSGIARNAAILEMGRKKPAERRPPREEF